MKPLALAIASLGVYSASLSAYADTSPEKIEVTGSRIKRVDAETAQPVEVISRADIAKSGKATVAEALRSITSNIGSYSENWTNSFSPGASGISLRGLGQKSTLVLINGRRPPSYGFAQNLSDSYFDLNSLPASAIERIEVLKDGASAIYGSDAIAGVVNVILRQDYKGLEVSAEQGISDENDLPESHVAITGGLGDLTENGYNVLASLDYFKRTGITYADRALTRNYDTSGKPGGTFNWANSGTYRTSFYTREAMANCPFGTATVDAAKLGDGYSGAACMYNPAGYTTSIPDTERINFFSHGKLKLGDSLQAFGEVFASHTSTQQSTTPASISTSNNSVVFDPTTGGVKVLDTRLPVGNAANPYSTPARFGYAFFDVGPRLTDVTSDAYRVLGGLRGTLKTWDWEFALSSAQVKDTQRNDNQVNAVALQDAITNGTYNFLSPTKAQTDALRLSTTRKATSKLYTADANIRGDLFSLPAGAVGAVFGFDARREQLDDVPDILLQQGYVLGYGSTQTHGARNVGAGYFEFSAPLFKSLELDIAGRGDKYSDFGSAFSPSARIKYTPFKELAFRASWGKGFRAPTLAENSQSSSTYFTSVTDKTPPDGHPELKNKSFSIAGVQLGNPSLKAEHSTSINFGIVAQPAKAIDFTVDYYRIKQKDLVGTDSLAYILAHENSSYQGSVHRDTETGQIQYITAQYRNLDYVQTSGIDVTGNWRIGQVGPGKLSAKLDWTHLIDWKTPEVPGGPGVNYVGTDGSPTVTVLHRNTGKLTFSWDAPVWSASVGINYYDAYKHFVDDLADYRVYDSAGENVVQEQVNSYITTDIFTSYNVTKALQATFSIQNIENRNPPYDGNYTAGYDSYDYNIRGRYYRLGVNYKF